jgi:cellulose synthase operon protein C
MKIVRTARLWFKEGTSDKLYEVDLVDIESPDATARFLVNFRFGRRGQILQDGSKTPAPVDRAGAEKVFDSVVVSKVNAGYRRIDGGDAASVTPPASAIPSPGGRERELLARLEACLHEPWPPEERDRLFWRAGEVRIEAAGALLLQLAERLGYAEVSYSLVWALARCAGPHAYDALLRVARAASDPLIRGLASFALASPLMGERRLSAAQTEKLPEGVARAIETIDLEAFCGAFAEFAQQAPVRVGPAIAELYGVAQGAPALHGLLVGFVGRIPVRPPYVPGLRRLFKYAEMIDDAPMFGAVARRFETTAPMYRRQWRDRTGEFISRVPEFHAYRPQPLTHLRGAADARTALSEATIHYLKRRIWRALRKRGELGADSFLEMATAYLLAFTGADLAQPRKIAYYRWENRRRVTHIQDYGPLAHVWGVGQLLHRHSENISLQPSSLTWFATADGNSAERGEAFAALWDAKPEYALRLASEACVEPVALFGLRVLSGKSAFLRGLPEQALGKLFASPFEAVSRFALEEARTRIAKGEYSESLIAALLDSALAEARELAIACIGLVADWPWSSAPLAFIAVTSAHEDVRAAALSWCAGRALRGDAAAVLANKIASWLAAAPASVDDGERSRVRHLRQCLRLLWSGHNMPLPASDIARILVHASPEVTAAGIDLLTLSGVDAGALPNALWQQLLNSPAPEIQAAALGLLNRLSDEQLAERVFLVLSFASAPSAEVRRAARPLVARLAQRFPKLADELARRLIDTLFQSAPDEDYVGDSVALLTEALPGQVAALDVSLVWRLLQAKAKGAQALGAAVLPTRGPALFSVRQLARLGNHPHKSVREWAMAAYEDAPDRIRAEADEAVLLVESEWPDAYEFALEYFERWPDEAWTPEVLGVVADSTKPKVLAFARSVLRRTLNPGDASSQLTRLLEHPATTMHLLITEVLTSEAAQDNAVFGKLLPLARIILMQVHKGRIAKDRVGAFLHAEALKSRERAERIAPLFADLSLSAIERDRTRAVLALRDISEAFPDLAAASPVQRLALRERTA